MGNTAVGRKILEPDVTPTVDTKPTFDPMLGFTNGRKARVMVASQKEMEAGKLPMEDRDYCAHLYLTLLGCRAANFPFIDRCLHERHAHAYCEYEDYVLRMKEYERERRLRKRQKRLQQEINTELVH